MTKCFAVIITLLFLCTACSHDEEIKGGYVDEEREFQTNFEEPITSLENIEQFKQIIEQAQQVSIAELELPTEKDPITVIYNSLEKSVMYNAYQLYLNDDQTIIFSLALNKSDNVDEAFLLSEGDSDALKELLQIEEAR